MSAFTWSPGPDGSLTLRHADREVAVLAVGSGIDAIDTPKPHLHPLRTPSGVAITGYAPADHPWHHGLMFAMPRVDDHNLWGGGTYLDPARGYVVIENQGVIRHLGWPSVTEGSSAEVTELVRWDGHDGTDLLSEHRTWRFLATTHPCAHVIDLDTRIESLTGADVQLETPAQNGRPDGGYGGLFLRLEEGFVLDALAGEPGTEVQTSGGISDTLVVHGRTPRDEPVTIGLAYLDGPTPGPRTWLHRFEPFAAIGWAIAYDDALVVPAHAPVVVQHRLAICDGHQDPELVRQVLAAPSTA